MRTRCAGAVAVGILVMVTTATLSHAQPAYPPCRQSNTLPVRWVDQEDFSDHVELAKWCDAVGPPLVRVDTLAGATEIDSLAILSWNVYIGGGDLVELVERFRSGHYTGGHPVKHFVVLLQEVHRAGPEVPTDYPDVYVPARKENSPPDGNRQDVVECAEALGLNIFYVPSMRNGKPGKGDTEEDRGNAILSTLPLFDLTAIELPYEKYRRVAVAATLRLQDANGQRHDVRICSAHLDNRTRFPRLLLSMGVGRLRQARALASALPERPGILGGDYNTWAPMHIERAVPELRKHFPQPAQLEDEPTIVARFRPDRRVDYIMYSVPERWMPRYGRLEDRLGSDHYPLLGWVTLQ